MCEDDKWTNSFTEAEQSMLRLAKPYLAAARDNDVHTRIALEFAFRLLETENGHREIVIPALILHDVGYSMVPTGLMHRAYGPRAEEDVTRIHEREGTKIAAAILHDIRYEAVKTAEILQIIDGHDTRKTALSLNDQIVKDADKLTRYSRNFWLRAGEFHMTVQELSARLEGFVEEWFFLAASRKIAREELRLRRTEAVKEGHNV
jgi:hypothetical protein